MSLCSSLTTSGSFASREPAADAVFSGHPAAMAASRLDAPPLTASMNRRFLDVKAINKKLQGGKNLRMSWARCPRENDSENHPSPHPSAPKMAHEMGSWRASNGLGSTPCRLGRRLRLMAGDAQALEIRVVIAAALSNIDDVVHLNLLRDYAAATTGVLIAKQDALPNAPPRPTASARTPLSLLNLLNWSSFQHLGLALEGVQLSHHSPPRTGAPLR